VSWRAILPGSTGADGRPATLGVMGGGQLGRMFVQAAQALGYATAVLDPDPASPAGLVAHYHVKTDYADEAGLAQLMQRCAAITTEFENVPAAVLRTLAAHRPLAPGADAVAVCQHRGAEKAQFARAGVACAPHAPIAAEADLAAVDAALLPGLLKTATLGYDGKGQQPVSTHAELAAAWAALGRVPCVLEQRLALAAELSVVVARDAAGRVVHHAPQRNWHHGGLLAVSESPARGIEPRLLADAVAAAHALADAMAYVGVLCVEFFVLEDGRLLANEMAPRPHNSAHHTLDSCDLSQFGLQVRTTAGLPLVAPRQHSAAIMLNLLGGLWFDAAGAERTPRWDALLALPGAHLHLYGKATPRPGRKMGHLTLTAADAVAARAAAQQAAALLGLPPLPAP